MQSWVTPHPRLIDLLNCKYYAVLTFGRYRVQVEVFIWEQIGAISYRVSWLTIVLSPMNIHFLLVAWFQLSFTLLSLLILLSVYFYLSLISLSLSRFTYILLLDRYLVSIKSTPSLYFPYTDSFSLSIHFQNHHSVLPPPPYLCRITLFKRQIWRPLIIWHMLLHIFQT